MERRQYADFMSKQKPRINKCSEQTKTRRQPKGTQTNDRRDGREPRKPQTLRRGRINGRAGVTCKSWNLIDSQLLCPEAGGWC